MNWIPGSFVGSLLSGAMTGEKNNASAWGGVVEVHLENCIQIFGVHFVFSSCESLIFYEDCFLRRWVK